jgi:hypothetical protein
MRRLTRRPELPVGQLLFLSGGVGFLAVVLLAIALLLFTRPAEAQPRDDLTRAFMVCVRSSADALEASGDTPQDVAQAAVFLCQREEAAAINADPRSALKLRETALFYGASQATIARLCRRTGRCDLAPVTPLPSGPR